MSGLILALLQVVHAGDAVLAVVLSAGSSDVVGVAERNDAAGGDQSDRRLADVGDGGARRDAVEHGHLVLGFELLALELGDQHLHGTFGADFVIHLVDADAALDVAFGLGRADRFALHLADKDAGHRRDGLAHAAGAVSRGNDVGVLLVQVDAGVLHVHGGDGGDAQLLADSLADGAAGGAVTAGVESGTGDEAVGAELLHGLDNEVGSAVHVLGEVRVAADDGGNDLGVALFEKVVERHTGADDAFAHFGRDVGLLFSADAGEELVDVMNYFVSHSLPSLENFFLLERGLRWCTRPAW